MSSFASSNNKLENSRKYLGTGVRPPFSLVSASINFRNDSTLNHSGALSKEFIDDNQQEISSSNTFKNHLYKYKIM